METKLKEPPFLAKMRKTVEWVGSTREDRESFTAGADAVLRLVSEHYYATPMLNPALVGQKRAEAADFYYGQKIQNLTNRLAEARAKRDELQRMLKELLPETDNPLSAIKQLNARIEGYKSTIKQLNQQIAPVAGIPKKEKKTLHNRLNEALHLLALANQRIKELEA